MTRAKVENKFEEKVTFIQIIFEFQRLFIIYVDFMRKCWLRVRTCLVEGNPRLVEMFLCFVEVKGRLVGAVTPPGGYRVSSWA